MALTPLKNNQNSGMSEHKKALKHLDVLISVLEFEGASIGVGDANDALQPKNPLVKPLNALERKKAFEQLKLLISRFCFTPSHPDELAAAQLEELPNIFLLLAELAIEAKTSEKNRKEKKKLLHLATLLLRHMLQMPNASYYRVLGLNDGATLTQIEKHYQLLCKLFWFDSAFDPQRRSRSRISTAYATLKDPGLRLKYNKQLAQQSLLPTPRKRAERKNSQWSFAAIAMLVVLGLVGTMFYFDKTMETDVTSSSQEGMLQQPETLSTEKVTSNEAPVISQAEQQLQNIPPVDVQVIVPEPDQTGHMPASNQQKASVKVPQKSDVAPASVAPEEAERPLLNDSNPQEKKLVRQEIVPSIVPTRDNPVVDVLPIVESLPLPDASSNSEVELAVLFTEPALIESPFAEDVLPTAESLPLIDSSSNNEIDLAALLAEPVLIGAPVAEDVLPIVESLPLIDSSSNNEIDLAALLAEPVLIESPVVEGVSPEIELHSLDGGSLKGQIEQANLPAQSVHDNPVVNVPPEPESSSLDALSLKGRIEKTALPSF